MPKAKNKQQDRKKRDKRRLLQQQAASARAWELLDLSAWFDTGVGFEQQVDEAVPFNDDSGQFIYPDWVPGERFFSYWAHEHPEDEAETAAVCLIKQIVSHASTDADAGKSDDSKAKDIVKKLKKLAGDGCVTASSYLGYAYLNGLYGRRAPKKAADYLGFSAGKKDPVACFWTAFLGSDEILPAAAIEDALVASREAGCPQAMLLKAFQIIKGAGDVTKAELDNLACCMIASASKGSWKCLDAMVTLLGAVEEEFQLRKKYGFAVLSLLEKFAAADFVPAVSRLADACLTGVLGPKNLEKGKHLLLRARALGDKLAGTKYAECLLTNARLDMSAEEKEQNTKVITDILEEEIRKGNAFPAADEMLGVILLASDNDESFARGISLLDNCIAHGHFNAAKTAAFTVPAINGKKEHLKDIIRLLNAMVRKKDSAAMFLRAHYYLESEFSKRQDWEKGLRLMHQSAEQDNALACFFLAQTYVFGLFGCEPDMEKAQAMADKGMDLDDTNCSILSGLILIGEFSARAKKLADEDIDNAFDRICSEFSSRDPYPCIIYHLGRTQASKALVRAELDDIFQEGRLPENKWHYYVQELANLCLDSMHVCSLGCVSFMAHALKKIAKTKYAKLYADIFAEKLSLGKNISCKGVAEYLQNFISGMPESYKAFSPGYYQYCCDKYSKEETQY